MKFQQNLQSTKNHDIFLSKFTSLFKTHEPLVNFVLNKLLHQFSQSLHHNWKKSVSKQTTLRQCVFHTFTAIPPKKRKWKKKKKKKKKKDQLLCISSVYIALLLLFTVTFHSKFFIHVCLEFMCAPDYLRIFLGHSILPCIRNTSIRRLRSSEKNFWRPKAKGHYRKIFESEGGKR